MAAAQRREAQQREARSERGGASWYRADEIRGVVGTAAAFILGFLRVGAQWTGAIKQAVGGVAGEDQFRSLILFHPLFARAQRVEARRARAAGAVLHTG